jgi:hypothetical protein
MGERDSDRIDELFESALKEELTIVISYWNVAEAAVVFDKFGRRVGNRKEALSLTTKMLNEMDLLNRSQSIVVEEVSQSALKDSITLVLKHRIYVADALQIATAKISSAEVFFTADRQLGAIAEKEGLKTVILG